MSRRTSKSIERLAQRIDAMRHLGVSFDFGLASTAELDVIVTRARAELEAYNRCYAELISRRSAFDRLESEVDDLSSRLLLAAAARFGRDSSEYVRFGGKRKSESKRGPKPGSKRRLAAPPVSEPGD